MLNNILKPALVLTIVSFIASLALSHINRITRPRINESIKKKKEEALGRVLPANLGYTIKEKMKKEIERFRLVDYEVKSKIVITEEDLNKYYQENHREYTETHELKLARIYLKIENPDDKDEIDRVKDLAEEIMRRLEQGDDFSDMAKAYSQGPAGPEGGCLGWIPFAQLQSSLKKMIARLSPGECTDVWVGQSGIQIIRDRTTII